MRWAPGRPITVILAALALLGTGCGGGQDQATDPVVATDDATDSAPAGDVDSTPTEAVDTPSESDLSGEAAPEGAIPSGFPASFPTPDGGHVATSSTLDGGDSLLVNYTVPGDPVEVAAAFRDQLKGAGFTIDRFQERSDGATFVATLDADEFTVTIGGDLYDDAAAKVKVGYSRP